MLAAAGARAIRSNLRNAGRKRGWGDPARVASADLCGIVSAEARHGAARRLRSGGSPRRCPCRTDGRDCRIAAVNGDCDRFGRPARPRNPYRGGRRRHRFAAWRQQVSDRRPGGRIHRAGRRDRQSPRGGWPDPGDIHGRCDADRCGFPAAWHLRQVRSLSGHRRLHGGHCGDHPRNSGQGSPRHHAIWPGARRVHPKAERARQRPAHGQSCGDCGRDWQHTRHFHPAQMASHMAGYPDRGRCCGDCQFGAGFARGDHWNPLWRNPARPALAGMADILRGQDTPCVARRDRLRAACGDRIAVVGRRRRRHDRSQASLELRVGGAGRRQYRIRTVWRHLRYRPDRSNRDQCPRRGARTGLGYAAFVVPVALHAAGRAAGEFHSAFGIGRGAGGGCMDHGGKARICHPDPFILGRCNGIVGHLPAYRFPRSHRRHRGRICARRGPFHQSHGTDHRHRGRSASRRCRPGRQ